MLRADISPSALLTNVSAHLIPGSLALPTGLRSAALDRDTRTLGIDYAKLAKAQVAAQKALSTYLDGLTPKDAPPAYSDVVEATAQPWRADDLLGSNQPKLRLLSLGNVVLAREPARFTDKPCRRRGSARYLDAVYAQTNHGGYCRRRECQALRPL